MLFSGHRVAVLEGFGGREWQGVKRCGSVFCARGAEEKTPKKTPETSNARQRRLCLSILPCEYGGGGRSVVWVTVGEEVVDNLRMSSPRPAEVAALVPRPPDGPAPSRNVAAGMARPNNINSENADCNRPPACLPAPASRSPRRCLMLSALSLFDALCPALRGPRAVCTLRARRLAADQRSIRCAQLCSRSTSLSAR